MINNCQLCPLHKNNPINCCPVKTYGRGKNIIIDYQPDTESMHSGIPNNISFDFFKKIFGEMKKEFQYTYLIHCAGEPEPENIRICTEKWLLPNIKDSVVFTLGNTYKFFNKKGDYYTSYYNLIHGCNIIHLQNPFYVLQKKKAIVQNYINCIKNYSI